MEATELLWTAVRGFGVYVLMLVILRLLGKRSIGAFSPFDLLVALMLGEVVDEIIYGDVSFLQGTVAIGTIALAQFLVEVGVCKSRKFESVVEGKPSIVIENGQFQRAAMRQERITEDEILSLLRLREIDDIREVRLGILESDGEISVIRHDWAEPVQKGDLRGEETLQKQRDTGGQEEPPRDKQTTSPTALGQRAA